MAAKGIVRTAVIETSPPSEKTPDKASDPVRIDVTRLPTDDVGPEGLVSGLRDARRTILHIYFSQPGAHKTITPVVSASQERRFGPTPKQQKARRATQRAERKARDATRTFPHLSPSGAIQIAPAPAASRSPNISAGESQHDSAYFLHTPYLSFHRPPSVLYIGASRYAPATPVALLHAGSFWRTYTIQLGASLAAPGVLDPRGVVSWAHNAARRERDADPRALKGYRVRGWRLWGESGRAYVQRVRELRKSGVVMAEPDVFSMEGGGGGEAGQTRKAMADEVVTVRWTRPLSRQTRTYGFTFRGVRFQWKGTGSVRESRRCGWMLRSCHLKLVASVPVDGPGKGNDDDKGAEMTEVSLATYTSSIAAVKSGALEIFDENVAEFVEKWMPTLLKEVYDEKQGRGSGVLEERIGRLKRSLLYQVIVATVLCVASAEKEKRHTLIDLIIGIAENGGNGGG